MEGRCLTFTTASVPSRPSTFFHYSSFHTALLPNTIITQDKRKRGLSVKASTHNFSTTRSTLSSNWDVSSLSKAPSWLPRFEELDTTNMLLRQRIVFLGSQIDETIADFIISQLLLLDAEDQKKDIKLFINSPGGSITSGMGIYDAMKLCKADISTVCVGLAASMGAVLLAAGTKGKRYCMPNARIMIHQPRGGAGGTSSAMDMYIRVRELAYEKNKLIKILSRITGRPTEQIKEDTRLDNFMSSWDAKDYGLVDTIIDDGKPGLVAPIADASPPPKTRVWHHWKIAGSRKERKNMPSEEKLLLIGPNDRQDEEKLLQNGHMNSQGDEQRSSEEKDVSPSPL